MECLSQAWSIAPCLWECSAEKVAVIKGLEDNLNSLRTAMDELNNLRQDVKNRVKEAEEQRMKCTNEVNGWLLRVETLEKEVNLILHKSNEELGNRCLGSCPKNCRYSYKLGKKVVKRLTEVKGLAERERFDVVADELPPPWVDELPMESAVVGFESKFEEVWQSVQNKDFPVIGLVGMGGVGKTTLLKQLNNEFLKRTHEYDLVIWIVVSKPANMGKTRDTIRNKLNIPDQLWENKSENQRVSLIFDKLKKKKFVVLLDDIWEGLELSEAGIPPPSRDNMSKVVFTTRSRQVCRFMDAHKIIDVGCLPPNQALSLFYSKVGEDVLKCHPDIKGLVEAVARECQGLPLALITIGRSMRGKTDAQQWKDAKRALEKYPSSFPGMEGRVFSKLIFSYDSLPTETLKKCFEYCSIFQKDRSIKEEEIIELWMAERLIDEYYSMRDALVQGRQIIESLMQASLLEIGESIGTFKMHDVIRDMALWVACERGEKKNKYWVDVVSDDISTAPNVMAKWRINTEKVSLKGSGATAEFLVGLSFCSNLVTLFIQDTQLEEVFGEVFRSLKVLKVLNLSHNHKLIWLPAEIGELTNLEYLNIMETQVFRLPVEVSQLKKLRFFIIHADTIILGEVISSLWSLQTFEQYPSTLGGGVIEIERRAMERYVLPELEGLKHIMDLRLVLTTAVGIQILLESPKVQSCISRLALKQQECLPDVLDLGKGILTKHLERLDMLYCYMSEIKFGRPSLANNVCNVSIWYCRKIRNVSSLIYVPNLCILDVDSCESMEELIGEDEEETKSANVMGMSLFSRLTSLTLSNLPKLWSICPQTALPFPSLKFMRIIHCSTLGKLPFDSNTAGTTPPQLKIEGEREWWDGLQWDSQATKDAFTPKLVCKPNM